MLCLTLSSPQERGNIRSVHVLVTAGQAVFLHRAAHLADGACAEARAGWRGIGGKRGRNGLRTRKQARKGPDGRRGSCASGTAVRRDSEPIARETLQSAHGAGLHGLDSAVHSRERQASSARDGWYRGGGVSQPPGQ